jgi:hypothetical protein
MFKEVPFCKPIISWELGMSTFKWGSTKIKRKTEKKTPYVIIKYLGIMIHYDLVYCPCLYCNSLCVVYLVRIDLVHFFDCLFIFVLPFKIKYIDYFNRFDLVTFCVPFPSQQPDFHGYMPWSWWCSLNWNER